MAQRTTHASPSHGRKVRQQVSNETDGLVQSFAAALKAASTSPDSDDAWNHLEELADELQRPDEVAALYRELIDRKLARDVWTRVAERGVRFHEEWFGDQPGAVTSTLNRVLERDPEAGWAFERLTVILAGAEAWTELLDVCDRALAGTRDPVRKRQLLDDAAHYAKDFAREPDRAADYLRQLLAIDPDNPTTAAALERLLERQERWTDLVELWRTRLVQLGSAEARNVRVQIAACMLERLGRPGLALEELRGLLDDHPGYSQACALLERIAELSSAPASVRRDALALLRTAYEVVAQPEALVAVLERAIASAEVVERRALHRELASRLSALGHDVRAIEHYAELLRADASDTDARGHIRELAERSGRHDLYVATLLAAAEASTDDTRKATLWLEAARAQRERLEDAEAAIRTYQRVLIAPDTSPSVVLLAAHELEGLLATCGRSEERLVVLEQLAKLEPAALVRRSILGQAARLADGLGELDRAISAWQMRLDHDQADHEALDALVDLLARGNRFEALIEALRRRADIALAKQYRRADLLRIAAVQADELGNIAAAIETWLTVRSEFGEDAHMLACLDDLMSRAKRFAELAALYEGSAATQRAHVARLLTRLADVYRCELAQPLRATEWYAHALALDPSNGDARSGISNLLEVPECATLAVNALVGAYRNTDDWQGRLRILEAQIAVTEGGPARAHLLREAARLQEQRAGDARAALVLLARALPLDAGNMLLEQELVRLGSRTGSFVEVAHALREAAQDVGHFGRAAELHFREGQLAEQQLGELGLAAEAYAAAAELDPTRLDIRIAAIRVAIELQSWSLASRSIVALARDRDQLDTSWLDALERAAEQERAWQALSHAWIEAISLVEARPKLARELELVAAKWFVDGCDDLSSARDALRRARDHDPAHRATLETLATIERKLQDVNLIDTLLRLDALVHGSLSGLAEAARLALEHHTANCRDVVERLYRRASVAWHCGDDLDKDARVGAVAVWALEELVRIDIAANDIRRATQLLLDGASLPVPVAKSVELRRRVADLLVLQNDRTKAVDVLLSVISDAPNDRDLVRRTASLCEQDGRVAELVLLRGRELELTEDPARRLELRMELSRLAGAIETRGGRVESLRANLAEVPGHEPTIDALCEILHERGRHGDAFALLDEQATTLIANNEQARAAALWTKAADIAETELGERARAITVLGRVVEFSVSVQVLDKLARLHLERDDPARAAHWLERRLELSTPKQHVAILLELARARLRADQQDEAIVALEAAFAEAPRNGEIRKLLFAAYRQTQRWDALVHALTIASEHVTDGDVLLAYAREAASLCQSRLGAAQLAVPVIERALAVARDDRSLRLALAEGLRAAGRLDEARDALLALVEEFGRRRSADRAKIHLELARVEQARGHRDDALEQLETAANIDVANVAVLQALAELARETGQIVRAERAYRTLLLHLRRTQAEQAEVGIGPAVVLIELSRIASDQAQSEQANELIESALEIVVQNTHEADAVERMLASKGEDHLLSRVLEAQLAVVQSPHGRADLLSRWATVLERLDRAHEALDARMQAIDLEPASPVQHAAARELAARLGQLERYISQVENQLTQSRRESDALVYCELLLSLGEVMEQQRDDLDKAAELYAKADATGVRQVDVWRAAARVAAARGDSSTQMRMLERLATLGEEAGETRADTLYRLAEVQLANDETLPNGLDSLVKALEQQPKLVRAAGILGRCMKLHPRSLELLDVFEQVARKLDDRTMLLEYLEARANHLSATTENAKEAADLALEMDQWERAEAMMRRAVDIGRDLLDAAGKVDWAVLMLAEHRMALGDLAGAVKWLGEVSDSADITRVFALGSRVAKLAEGSDLALAAELYEQLLERNPAAREAWEPLAGICVRLGRIDRLERLLGEVLDGLRDTADRNALRIMLVHALLSEPGREEQALAILKDVLLEDPDDTRAQLMLIEHLERTGQRDELIATLHTRLSSARERNDRPAVKAFSLRLYRDLADASEQERLSVVLAALESIPDDVELLRLALQHSRSAGDPHKHLELLGRLLMVAPEPEAAAIAIDLMHRYEAMDRPDGCLRALELGYERAPSSEVIREHLERIYRERSDYAGLVRMLDAARANAPKHQLVPILRESATVHRDLLFAPSKAIELLKQACTLAPDDIPLQLELASTHVAAGEPAAALDSLTSALERTPKDDPMLPALLRTRADMRGSVGDHEAALVDLEVAYQLDPDGVARDLSAALNRQRVSAAQRHDSATERVVTLRMVDVLMADDATTEARELLANWADKSRKDVAALYRLRDLDTSLQRWMDVASTCARLVALENDAAQIDAAVRLSEACSRVGQPAEARAGLEHARRKQPGSAAIRAELRKIYEIVGARRELGTLLVEDAHAASERGDRVALLRSAVGLLLADDDASGVMPVLHELLEAEPGDLDATVTLVDLHLREHRIDEADSLLDDVIKSKNKRSPALAVLQHRKADVARARGDGPGRLAALQQAFTTDKNNGLVAAELADLAEQLEDWDLAAKTLRSITMLSSACPITKAQAFLRQGKIALRTGDRQRAILWARRARQEDPNEAAVGVFLGQIGEL